MATKTIIKLLLSKYAPLSIEMQKAVIADQSVINDAETLDVDYVDEGKAVVTHEELKELAESKWDSFSPEEQINIERILKNKEEASYPKLLTLFNSK